MQNLSGLVDKTSRFTPLDPSQRFSNLFNAYTKAVNKVYVRTGALFQRPFGRIEVDSAAYYRRLVVYIHQNPQLHGFVTDFRTWPYSSFRTFFAEEESCISRCVVLNWFHDQQAFLQAHDYFIRHQQVSNLIPEEFYVA